MTIPGVGPITALTWALEVGDVQRFRFGEAGHQLLRAVRRQRRVRRARTSARRFPSSATSICRPC